MDLNAEFQEVVKKLDGIVQDPKINYADKVGIIADYWLGKVGAMPRRFDFQTPFPAADDHCTPTFARKFTHTNWVDGEDVVQAGETPTEAGFNRRFNDLRTDLDALNADTVRLFGCLAEMRRSLRALLDEMRAELNRLHADVFSMSGGQGAPATIKPGIFDMVDQQRFKGVIEIDDKFFHMWETPHGIVVLPPIAPAVNPAGPLVSGATPNPRVTNPVVMGRHMAERPPIREAFAGGPLTKEKILDQFGDERMADGRLFRDAFTGVPSGTPFASPEELIDAAARAAAETLRTEPAGSELVRNAFVEGARFDRPENARVSETRFMSPAVSDALTRSGVATVGELARLTAKDVMERANAAGVDVSAREAAEAVAIAQLTRHLR